MTSKPSVKKTNAQIEAGISAKITKWMEDKLDCVVLRTHAGHIVIDGRHIHLGRKGTSDRTVCLPNGMFCAVEVKKPGEDPTEDQERYLSNVRKRHGIAIAARSVEEVRAALVAELGLSVVVGWEATMKDHVAQLRLAPHNRRKAI